MKKFKIFNTNVISLFRIAELAMITNDIFKIFNSSMMKKSLSQNFKKVKKEKRKIWA